ncbi:putative BRO1 domain-containing protein BROX [Helianthus annuus]|uniref:BRO1 domain-containing protein BROX n=1 Tax=Helianthus annuus TaxID=4232 RepID=A0A251S7F7_HELAN|nr:BRO1 domain-containing protein BROX homolog [Helianthus annuus]KAF5763954.1 putative BRO1 domain-containing protein BROX [Helianthus annuus]KAJ0450715.1 putative BRO1 domain-containing protein BROX [Helianthus annuus]KAJ0472562.1 putative BRO1 domain-containing protein BROX [Helianthus annuus]KAJ0648166.1 putative BRO1 domain-containing protein BROX [Helianthus annuus]KAJ0652010.1 putative BRO1 domain-containing protein BROX [Helianthus annuus]
MGCAVSVYRVGGNKKQMKIPVVTVFVPSVRVPVNSSFQKSLKGVVPKELIDRLTSFRNQIALLTQQTDVSAAPEVLRALEEYLSLLVGLTDQEFGFRELTEFKWKSLDDGRQDISVADSWFELLSVVHMMAMLTLMEANSKLIPDQTVPSETVESTDDIGSAVDLLVKAAGYLQFCLREILVQIPPHIKMKLPVDLQENVLEATYIQALGQGTEMQLASAVECKNATLSVKRRLACEQLSYFSQAHYCLSTCDNLNGYGKKHLSFIKWKFLEAKAAAYYYHGLITDKGTEPSCHITAVCCFLAAEEILTESKKACLNFCLTAPITRAPTAWGAMKHLNKKIPETAAKKSQMYAYLLEEEKSLDVLPELPEFELSLKADEFQMPDKDAAWENEKWKIPSQTLKTDDEEDDK